VAALDFYNLIQSFSAVGADLNVRTVETHLTPLIISAALGHEKTLKRLLTYGAVFWEMEGDSAENSDSGEHSEEELVSEIDSVLENEKKSILRSQCSRGSARRSANDEAIEMALLNRHHDIVEMLLRDASLKRAMEDKSQERSGEKAEGHSNSITLKRGNNEENEG